MRHIDTYTLASVLYSYSKQVKVGKKMFRTFIKNKSYFRLSPVTQRAPSASSSPLQPPHPQTLI